MKALDFPLLADENVHPDVIVFLREAGLDVASVSEQGKFGLPDTQVLQQATGAGRAVLTHDSDFGGMAVFSKKFIGIIYLRLGHIRADFTIKSLEAIRGKAPEVTPPFILVAERAGDTVKNQSPTIVASLFSSVHPPCHPLTAPSKSSSVTPTRTAMR